LVNRVRFTTLLVAILVLSIISIISVQDASAAGKLNKLLVEPTNNLFSLESHYVIGFTTGTTGTIKTINMTFPVGYDLSKIQLIEASGIGTGTISLSGQSVLYNVITPVSIPKGTSIMIMMGKIVNSAVTQNNLNITTIDPFNITIDGPTKAPTLTLKSVTSTMLATNAVIASKIFQGAVINSKISNNAINGTQIQANSLSDINISPVAAIALYKLGAGILPANVTIDTANIADASIVLSKMAENSVGTVQLLNQSVTMDKLAIGSVGSIQIANGAVGSTQIAVGAVGSTQIANGAVGSTQIGSGAVGSTQIANGAVGSTQIGSGAVGSTQIANGAVGSTQIGTGAVGSTQIANGAVGSTQIANGAVGSTQIANGAVSSTQIANGTIRSVNMSPSFFKKVTLQDTSAGNALGWNPDHILTTFTISDSSVKSNSVISITVTSGPSSLFVCGVYDITPATSFSIRCTAPVLDSGVLSYIVIN